LLTERVRVARVARAEGAEVAARIRAGAERERTVILAEAQAQADIIRGSGEREAIRIFAEAFQQDPQFFAFWRSLQAYREAFGAEGEGRSMLILTPDSDFFRFLKQIPQDIRAAAVRGPVARAGMPLAALVAALGLVLAAEGLLYALFPETVRGVLARLIALSDQGLRAVGLGAASLGAAIALVASML
jgi:uncharacterized protein YjeT (DUF2065 family)